MAEEENSVPKPRKKRRKKHGRYVKARRVNPETGKVWYYRYKPRKKKKYKKTRRVNPANGNVYYYHYKKKRGGGKKRGRKKKKKTFWIRRIFLPWNYKIVLCLNKRFKKKIGRYHNEVDAMAKKAELLEENKKVILPALQLNNGRIVNAIQDLTMEYLILKKVEKDKFETNVSKHPNNFGKLVDHATDDEDWVIIDKFPCVKEESFWVYGYDKVSDRKDITWIFENLIKNKITSKYDVIRVVLYNNKVIFIDDSNQIEFVLCKNKSDGIRVYNILSEQFCKKMKPQVVFLGAVKPRSETQKEMARLIQEKTGWTLKEVHRGSTRH